MPTAQKLTKNQKIRRGKPVPRHELKHYAPYMLAVGVLATVGAVNLFGSKAASDGVIAFRSAGDIYVVNPDGTRATNLTNTTAVEKAPVWSPDGSRLAYISDHSGSDWVYTADYDEKTRSLSNIQAVRDIRMEGENSYPVWIDGRVRIVVGKPVDIRDTERYGADASPNSNNVVYVGGEPGSSDLLIHHSDTQADTVLYASPNDDTQPDWRP